MYKTHLFACLHKYSCYFFWKSIPHLANFIFNFNPFFIFYASAYSLHPAQRLPCPTLRIYTFILRADIVQTYTWLFAPATAVTFPFHVPSPLALASSSRDCRGWQGICKSPALTSRKKEKQSKLLPLAIAACPALEASDSWCNAIGRVYAFAHCCYFLQLPCSREALGAQVSLPTLWWKTLYCPSAYTDQFFHNVYSGTWGLNIEVSSSEEIWTKIRRLFSAWHFILYNLSVVSTFFLGWCTSFPSSTQVKNSCKFQFVLKFVLTKSSWNNMNALYFWHTLCLLHLQKANLHKDSVNQKRLNIVSPIPTPMIQKSAEISCQLGDSTVNLSISTERW